MLLVGRPVDRRFLPTEKGLSLQVGAFDLCRQKANWDLSLLGAYLVEKEGWRGSYHMKRVGASKVSHIILKNISDQNIGFLLFLEFFKPSSEPM